MNVKIEFEHEYTRSEKKYGSIPLLYIRNRINTTIECTTPRDFFMNYSYKFEKYNYDLAKILKDNHITMVISNWADGIETITFYCGMEEKFVCKINS